MSLQRMAKVLLVGSGVTGAATAAFLRQNFDENVNITIWDKGRGAGGRMATSRNPEDGSSTLDLGAQYITVRQDYMDKRRNLYTELQSCGVLCPMEGKVEGPNQFDKPGAEHFVTPRGVSSLVKYFLQKAGTNPKFQQQVTEVSFEQGQQVSVTTHEDVTEAFDVVVLTLPVPQILQLRGSIHEAIASASGVKQKLQNVSYSSRYAMGLFFPTGTKLNFSWTAKYFADDPCIRYIAIDDAKRGVENSSGGQTMVVHTTVPYGLQHLENDLSEVKEEVLTHLYKVLPDLPQPMHIKPQRWRYSQVHEAYEGKPGCIALSKHPLVILAGDGFSHSTLDGCLDSAEAVLQVCKESAQFKTSSAL